MKHNEQQMIIWDFDGVIIFSDEVRIQGFEHIFRAFPDAQVTALLDYHKRNGGLSRYVKIRYFFEEILKKPITDKEVNIYAEDFSGLMRTELTNKKRLNGQWLAFMENHGHLFTHHIASGSDEKELNFLCRELNIHPHFVSINGSPTPKVTIVKKLVRASGLPLENISLIGDAINDYDAAFASDIAFYGYNNPQLRGLGSYLDEFDQIIVPD